MEVAGGGVDVGVAEQRLHHREVDAGLGERGPERVTERVRVTGGDAGLVAVIAEDGAKPRRRERLAAPLALCATTNSRVLVVSGRSASR